MPLPPPSAPQGAESGLRSADGRRIELALASESGRDLAAVLKPGKVLSGRVLERFANGAYLFALRGRNLIAESRVPLLRDSVVRFQVLGGGDGLSLRLLDGGAARDAFVAGPGADPQRLGLADTAIARQAITLFEQAGAPLVPGRLAQAVEQGSASGTQTRNELLAAHALLARAGLPVTPATLTLARAATGPGLPQAAAALPRGQSSPAGTPTADPPPATPGAAAPRATTALPGAPATGAASTPGLPPNATPAPPALPANAPATAHPAPAATANLGAHGPSVPLPNANTLLLPDPARGGVAAARSALELAGLRPAASTTTPADASAGAAAERARGAEPAPASPTTVPPPPPSAASLVQQLAATIRELEAQGEQALPRAEALAQGGERALAQTVLPPSLLDDYDLVLPLPLMHQGRPMPARLAVATQHGSNGATATFLRVDVELDRLGPLSIRFSGVSGGSMSILLLGTGPTVDRLEAERQDLRAQLEELGIGASIRVGNLLAEATHGR